MKKIISMFLAVMIVLTGLPIGELVAWAATNDPKIELINVTKVFRDLYGAEKYSILITGTNFLSPDGKNQVEVGIMGDDGIIKNFDPITKPSNTTIQYELKLNEISDSIYIGGKRVAISEEDMPTITNKTPTTGVVDNGGDGKITLTGKGFLKLSNELRASLFQGPSKESLTKPSIDTEITSTALKGKTGSWGVMFEKTSTAKIGTEDIPFIVTHRYLDVFSILNSLDVSKEIDLIPTQGPVNSIATLQADNLKPTGEMSVFFLKNLDDPYLATHMGINENYRKDDNTKKDIFSFTVPPALSLGSYYVVLTNEVDPKKDIKGQIKSYKILDSKFTVIDRKNMLMVEEIDPEEGPSTGIDAQIKGINIGRLSTDIYEKGTMGTIDIKTNNNKMIVPYTGGKYKMIGNDGVDVEKLTREISILVGGEVTFRDGSKISENKEEVYDYINIRVGENNDKLDLTKDVIVEVSTKIEYEENGIKKSAEIFERGVLKDGFTYQPLTYTPKITSLVPDKIPVNKSLEAMEGLKLSIVGENFLLYRYLDSQNKIVYKYPTFDFGNQFIIDPNTDNIEIKILDKQGNEIDGTKGNDLGTKILLTIPSSKKIKSEDVLNSQLDFKVTNPVRVPDSNDIGASATYKFQFIKPESDKTPSILSVSPDSITTEGRAGVVIKGENFSEKFNLYMDGEKINGAKRNGVGTEIIFDAPPKSEGYVQLIVQNDNGAIAVFDYFLYVKTYTNPKIIDFNPKKGSANTLVDLKGENLVPPNPFVKDITGLGLMKLVGTRIFMDGKDINTYNSKGLVPYDTAKNSMNMIKAEGNNIVPSDYYHSIILEENGIYYKIYFDTNLGEYILTNGDTENYTLSAEADQLYGKKPGQEKKKLDITSTQIKIDGKVLAIKTLYEVNKDGKITGNRVMVKNNNELHFIVPPQHREGFYDLAIVNPDTNRDERKGNAGFYYNFQPQDFPKIEKIDPSEGSTEGQYNTFITGTGFFDRGGDQKTSVTIGGVVVPSKDVIVSPDGNGLTVKVPKYPGDLSTETEMDRKYVNVTVTNPGGGSDSKINGFAYIIPISDPKITALILNKGTAAGGETVTIEGSDFRYFEPFRDTNNNGTWDKGEPFTNKNGNTDENGDEKWDDLRDEKVFNELKSDWDGNILPILPTVYFGGKVAKIKGFTASSIDVETPKGIKGSTPVYIVNNDYGVSNTLMFNYESSSPKINSITPASGRKQGKDKVELLGDGFGTSGVLVQFGSLSDKNISNSTIAIGEPNSGRIRDKLSTIKIGNLTVKYDATKDSKTLSFSIEENKIVYGPVEISDYKDNEIFFDLSSLKDENGVSYSGYEEVRVKMEIIEGSNSTYRVRVDRGFSPGVTSVNSKQVIVETPSYYSIGNVPVTLINPDGGTAKTNFNYRNPDSNPTITNIKRDGEEGYKVDDGRIIVDVIYSGGNVIEITGTDFRKPVKITIGDFVVNSKIEYEPENESVATKLTFEMPPMSEKYIGEYLRLVVENEDGGYASSEPRFIHITKPESIGLEITKVTPNFGPTAGGTTVTIEGKDFRETMDGLPGKELKVYFGRGKDQVLVPASDIISVSFDKIVLKTPPFTAGLADIKVENPDGNIVILKDGFNYVSNPKITSVVNPDNDKFVIETISIEGGEKIKIIGSDFMEGARVVFNPVLKLVEDDKQATGDIITIDDRKYILESGVEGTEVERINGQTITVTTPPGKLGDKGVIVINPDKGATNIYNIVYGIPEIGAPFNVRAEVVFDQFIRVSWTGVKEATQYEIYMSEDGGKFEFIDTTELTSYAVQKLKPNRKYQFLVKAMGKYGTSKPIDESKSNIVRTGSEIGPIDNDGKPADKTETKVNGTTADIIIGAKDFTAKGMVIDLTRGNLAGVNDITIRIPASVVSSSLGKIQVIGKDYRMEFAPSIFKTSTIEDNKSRSNVGVVFKIATHKDNIDVKAGNTIVGGKYNLEAVVYVDKDLSKIDYINGSLGFVLDQDPLTIKNRRLTNIKTVRYDNSSKNWIEAKTPNRLGLYTVIGSRR